METYSRLYTVQLRLFQARWDKNALQIQLISPYFCHTSPCTVRASEGIYFLCLFHAQDHILFIVYCLKDLPTRPSRSFNWKNGPLNGCLFFLSWLTCAPQVVQSSRAWLTVRLGFVLSERSNSLETASCFHTHLGKDGQDRKMNMMSLFWCLQSKAVTAIHAKRQLSEQSSSESRRDIFCSSSSDKKQSSLSVSRHLRHIECVTVSDTLKAPPNICLGNLVPFC